MTLHLVIDQSTSGTKALLFQVDGTLIDSAAMPHGQHYPRPGWVEHDAEEIYRNVIAVARELLARHPERIGEIANLSITNQRETFVVFDRSTGEALYHAIVWQCRRGDDTCVELTEAGHSETVQRVTGLKIDTYFPASKITWLLQAEPGIKQQLIDGTALLGTIETYLIYRLTDGAVFASDHTNACRTLLYDINQLAWSEDMCRLFDVPMGALPEVRESSAHYGDTRLDGVLDAAIPIYGVMGDSQAALFAQRAFTPGQAKVTFGTGSSVLLNIGDTMRLSDKGIVTTLGWVHDGEPVYAFEGIINFTGATIGWLQNQLQLIDDPAETEDLARSVDDNGGVYLIPAFVGLSAPYWNPQARAAIVGMTPYTTKAHIARAALEAIAYRVRDVLGLMRDESGLPLDLVYGDGGMVRNGFLMQFTADMIGITLRASTLPELSSLGAVLSGLLGMGIHESMDDLAALPHPGTDYAPAMDAAVVKAHYTGWQDAVRRML